mmetsp:Transcript_45994/g.92767  ORF Transcript_45994/g.92767 Transcript_45994/m.92767 type:complete len:230 (+) Transcript_45994:359-1048(+)
MSLPQLLVATVLGSNNGLCNGLSGLLVSRDCHHDLRRPGHHVPVAIGTVHDAPEEVPHLLEVRAGIEFDDVVVTSGLREVPRPTKVLGDRLCEPVTVVEGNYGIFLPVHDEGGATDLLHMPVVRVEVEAMPHTGGLATSVRLRVYDLDAGEHRGVQDDAAQLVRRCQSHGRATTNTLPVRDDLVGGHACSDEVGVGRLGVLERVPDRGRARGHAIASVLHSNNIDAQML